MFCIRSLQSDNDTLYPFYDDEYSEEVKCLLSCGKNKRFIESAIVAVWHSKGPYLLFVFLFVRNINWCVSLKVEKVSILPFR